MSSSKYKIKMSMSMSLLSHFRRFRVRRRSIGMRRNNGTTRLENAFFHPSYSTIHLLNVHFNHLYNK